MNEAPEKTPAPDPEIPDELKAKLAKSKRPAGYSAINDDLDTPAPEVEKTTLRDTRKFFKALAAVLKDDATFYRTIIEEKDVKRRIAGSRSYETIREKVAVKIPVALVVGEDGLPYASEAISSTETARVRSQQYPGAPKMSPMLGDLTPEFVEWLYLNHPYDAAVRYFARSTHVQAAAIARAS